MNKSMKDIEIVHAEVQGAIVNLYSQFQADVISAGNYTDEDFGFKEFMRWLIQNNP